GWRPSRIANKYPGWQRVPASPAVFWGVYPDGRRDRYPIQALSLPYTTLYRSLGFKLAASSLGSLQVFSHGWWPSRIANKDAVCHAVTDSHAGFWEFIPTAEGIATQSRHSQGGCPRGNLDLVLS